MQIIPTVNILYNKISNQLIFCHNHKHVVIIDVESYRVINMYTHSNYFDVNIDNICRYVNHNTLAINHSSNIIALWNLESYEIHTRPKPNGIINLTALIYYNTYIYKNKFQKISLTNFIYPINLSNSNPNILEK